MSRAARSAFAHVVVLMDTGLDTTPAEEVPAEGFEGKPAQPAKPIAKPTAEYRAPQDLDAAPVPQPTKQPHPAAKSSLPMEQITGLRATMTEDKAEQTITVQFDRIDPPKAGKKAKIVRFFGERDGLLTMHAFDGIESGQLMDVNVKASKFNDKINLWADSYTLKD